MFVHILEIQVEMIVVFVFDMMENNLFIASDYVLYILMSHNMIESVKTTSI